MLFLAAEPLTDKIVWDSGNKYTFRLRASTFMQTAMLVPEAAKLGKKRWAIVYPNYEYGQSATAAFKKQMIVAAGGRPRVRRAGGAARQDRRGPGRAGAARRASPTRSSRRCSAPTSRASSAKGELRGLFKDRPVFNLLGGEPEYLDPLKDEAPVGWYVTGYPWYAIDTPRAQALPRCLPGEVQRLSAPGLGRRLQRGQGRGRGDHARRARPTPRSSSRRCRASTFDSPFGKVTFRALDHQSTMGAYVGRTAVKDGKGVMVDWRYADGKDYLPSDETVKRLRPKE